jgi:hypothetical protein
VKQYSSFPFMQKTLNWHVNQTNSGKGGGLGLRVIPKIEEFISISGTHAERSIHVRSNADETENPVLHS